MGPLPTGPLFIPGAAELRDLEAVVLEIEVAQHIWHGWSH